MLLGPAFGSIFLGRSQRSCVYELLLKAMIVRLSVAPEEQELKLGRVWERLCRGPVSEYPASFFCGTTGPGANMLLNPVVLDYATGNYSITHPLPLRSHEDIYVEVEAIRMHGHL